MNTRLQIRACENRARDLTLQRRFLLCIMTVRDSNNPFDYFKSELEEIFKINQRQLDALISSCNKTAYGAPAKKLAEIFESESDYELADMYGFALCCVSYEYLQNKGGAQNFLTKSGLTSKTKKGIGYFFSKLTDKGLHGLEIQYHVSGNMFDFPALYFRSNNNMLVEIKDISNKTIAYLPLARIQFGLDGDDKKTISAEFSQDKLAHLISTLQSVYDRNSELVKMYKNSIKSAPVIEWK